MIIKADTELGCRTEIRDCEGNVREDVLIFDTETNKAVIYGDMIDNQPIYLNCTLKGYKAYDKFTNKEIK